MMTGAQASIQIKFNLSAIQHGFVVLSLIYLGFVAALVGLTWDRSTLQHNNRTSGSRFSDQFYHTLEFSGAAAYAVAGFVAFNEGSMNSWQSTRAIMLLIFSTMDVVASVAALVLVVSDLNRFEFAAHILEYTSLVVLSIVELVYNFVGQTNSRTRGRLFLLLPPILGLLIAVSAGACKITGMEDVAHYIEFVGEFFLVVFASLYVMDSAMQRQIAKKSKGETG